MKKIILTFAIMAFFIPTISHAFSFSDLMWWRNKEAQQEEVKVELNQQQKIGVKEKLAKWILAYKQNDLSLFTNGSRFTTISEVELNYILQEQLSEYNNPPIQDVEVSLSDGKIILKGYALKPLRGSAYIELRIEVMEEQLYFHVSKARYKGLPIPGLFVGRLLYKYLEPVSEFFFTNEGVELRDIVIDDQGIKFVID